jgi:hypothetical protein
VTPNRPYDPRDADPLQVEPETVRRAVPDTSAGLLVAATLAAIGIGILIAIALLARAGL